MVAQSVIIIIVGILSIIEIRMAYNLEKLKIENQKIIRKVDVIENNEKEILVINKFLKDKINQKNL